MRGSCTEAAGREGGFSLSFSVTGQRAGGAGARHGESLAHGSYRNT